MLLGTLGTSFLGNVLAGKGINKKKVEELKEQEKEIIQIFNVVSSFN